MSRNATKQDEQLRDRKKSETILRLFKYLLSYKMIIAVVLLIMAGTTTIALINPLLIERAIDVNIANGDISGLTTLLVVGLGLNILYLILVKVRMYLMARMSNDVLVKIREELYVHIQTLSLNFFDSRPTGKILARIMGDVNALKDVLSNTVTTLLPSTVTIIAVLVIMFLKNPVLAAATLWSMPIMVVSVFFIQKASHKGWQSFHKKSSNLNAFVHEDVSGIRIVQSFNAEKETRKTYHGLLKEHYDAFIKAAFFVDWIGPVTDCCWVLGLAAMYYVGVKVIGTDNIHVGTLIAFATYAGMFWNPIRNLSGFFNQIFTNLSRAERVFEIMDTPAEIKDEEGVEELPKINGEVRFENVSFHYDDDPDVLRDVSFTIEPGQTIALVGPTGAGKTTIVNLISRFYDIQKGRILVDGYDVKKVSINSLRKQMGVMTQDNFLFSGTVRDNIRYGRLDATDEEIEAAAKAVNAHEFIMKMENGYDTEIKERGAGLSAGQKQLIAFARTMVSDPRILILDEATSSIDTHTELMVQQGIENLLKGRTSFVIAHRLSTIQKADRIFVIDEGGIKEQGTSAELLRKKGEYYNLYMAQFKAVSIVS